MTINLDVELGGILGPGGGVTADYVDGLLEARTADLVGQIETMFGQAGWYEGGVEPYEPPSVPFDAPLSEQPPVVHAIRRLWLARYNPAAEDWDDPLSSNYANDIEDDTHFPWRRPELAPKKGWWLGSEDTPGNRYALAEVTVGDVVVLQRTDPGPGLRKAGEKFPYTMLVGVAAVVLVDTWTDASTGRREYRACLVPMAKFTYPVPVPTAKRQSRLKGKSFSQPQQLPGRRGPLGFTLSAVEWEDAADLLAVCGIHPSVLAEPSVAVAAARLRAGETGNRRLLKLRYDHVFQDKIRRQHEREGIRRARVWAELNDYVERQDCQDQDGVGFDLLFVDIAGKELQLEVKGYTSRRLADVQLQPSQGDRAKACAAGQPPEWRLFALLGAGGRSPVERVVLAAEALALIAAGGLKVKRRRVKA